ncbi:Kinesin-like protein [Paramicrosporidium saccamoebae]|uniref:Kinesin-like protein n=1 Tax=Paramicrosporidium saccamoebae TaxID=1246581 RepID=A0A2H9TMX9_9FUNG|nr:Kinesin-like protein [Paramicrosporidium saccamoebae]
MYPTSRIPVPRSVKRYPPDATHRIALASSPSQQKAARTALRSPRKFAPLSPSTAMRRISFAPTPKRNTRLSMYGVPVGLEKRQGGSRRALNDGKRIMVCARKRPMSSAELRTNATDCMTVDCERNTLKISASRTRLDGLTKYAEDFDFSFDRVFDADASNSKVYRQVVRPLVEFALKGGKSTCFAYGQTGSGKTHTMFHPKDGLCNAAIKEILEASGSDGCYISFFEIYQSQLYDLLRERKKVVPCERSDGQVKIMGLGEDHVSTAEESLQLIQRGLATRVTGKTGANAQSSRSHAILQFSLKPSSDCGRLTFIDLAGSERGADRAEVDYRTKLEGSEINKSLLALKECIRAMDMASSHFPFRQSKLTLVLKNSIIGNVRTAMIATVSPTLQSCEHTLNTLRYADRFRDLGANNRAETEVEMEMEVDDSDASEGFDGEENEPLGNTNSWTVSPMPRDRATPVKTVTFASPDRLERRRRTVMDTITRLQHHVQQCTDADVLELLGEELVTLTSAFQTLA